MNLITFINRNIFFKKMFPDGIKGKVLVGKFSIDLSMNCEIHFHITDKPSIEINKFGLWGVDYNTIVIKTLGLIGDEVCIRNWNDAEPSDLEINQQDQDFIITSSGKNRNFYIKVKGIIFQDISVYYNDK